MVAAEKRLPGSGDDRPAPAVHPAVKVHPETKRKSLFLGQRVRRFVGMTEEESRPLLDFLKQHAVAYEFTYRHRWNMNDLLMWDNRCTLHIALCDYIMQRDPRLMMRCAVTGPESGYSYTDDDRSVQSEAVVS